jgi:4-amino-4-deoxy-L-arabinose transferase-like glycosyltransferase
MAATLREQLRTTIGQRRFVAGCLIAGGLIRLAWISFLPNHQVFDFAEYSGFASRMAQGAGYSIHGLPSSYWPVGYPAFLSAIYRLFGFSEFAGKLANVVLDLSTILLAYLFSLRVFRSETAAGCTVLILSFWPNHIAYCAVLSSETLFAFLLLAASVLFVSAPNRPAVWVLSGLLWGMATLTKTQALFVPLVFLLIFGGRGWTKLKSAVVVYFVVGIVIAPWIVRNERVFGRPALSNTGGIDLLMGNHDHSQGLGQWDADVRSLIGVQESELLGGDETARDQRAFQLAVHWIRANPLQFFLLWPRKLFVLYRSDMEGMFYAMGSLSKQGGGWLLAYSAGRLVAEAYYLGALVLFLLSFPSVVRSGDVRWASGLVLCAYFTLVYCVFIADSRYHFTIMPWVAMYSGLGGLVLLGPAGPPSRRESRSALVHES